MRRCRRVGSWTNIGRGELWTDAGGNEDQVDVEARLALAAYQHLAKDVVLDIGHLVPLNSCRDPRQTTPFSSQFTICNDEEPTDVQPKQPRCRDLDLKRKLVMHGRGWA